MADFCKQCSEKMFGKDFGDLANLTGQFDDSDGKFATVICEGCGLTAVNSKGKCMNISCLEEGHGEIRSGAV